MRGWVSGRVVTTLAVGAMLLGCSPAAPPADPIPTPMPSTGGALVAPLTVGPAAALVAGPTTAGVPLVGGGAVDTTGGSIPDGQMISPFDVKNPVLAFLDPLLLKAIQDATRAAATEGVDVMLTSGWRSKGFQKRLFAQGVTTYGGAAAASQFVASPEASMHVLGKAVDVGPVTADDWMIHNGARFGLCQIYANEIWHFELAVDAQGSCPPLRPNAAG
jgi:hypothetical protein